MKSATNKLVITIVATILLPLILYSVYEISSVKEGEEVIEKVYKDQLDAILFSVNQYSDDIINGLLNKIEDQISSPAATDSIPTYLKYSNFEVIILKDVGNRKTSVIKIGDNTGQVNWQRIQDTLFNSNQELIGQLLKYREDGYRKVVPKERFLINEYHYQPIHAILEGESDQPIVFVGIMDIPGFVENVLSPKLQQIADDELVITLGERGTENYTYVTDSLNKEVMFKKPMWLFPEMEIGISSKNKTVTELVEERTRYNLIAAFILILLLIFGFSLVVRNLRKEIQLAQTKSDFVSNVSHELRTPLSLISMFAETLLFDRVPSHEKRKEYENIIFKETNRLTNIVNKILNFSQIEASKKVYHPTDVDLNRLLEELLHDYAYHLERNGFTYEVVKKDGLPPLWLDKEAMYEALVNLLDNAMKYSPEEKHIILRTGYENRRIFVEVEDRGIGIAADQIRQIFDKFYRVSEGNVHTTQGAGLGLALVDHLMNTHGGDIEVESTPGKGSIFRLVFNLEKNGKDPNSRR